MYTVYRFGKKHTQAVFRNYEKARQHVRRTIRAMYPYTGDSKDRTTHTVEASSRWALTNPSIGDFGFSIKTTAKTK